MEAELAEIVKRHDLDPDRLADHFVESEQDLAEAQGALDFARRALDLAQRDRDQATSRLRFAVRQIKTKPELALPLQRLKPTSEMAASSPPGSDGWLAKRANSPIGWTKASMRCRRSNSCSTRSPRIRTRPPSATPPSPTRFSLRSTSGCASGYRARRSETRSSTVRSCAPSISARRRLHGILGRRSSNARSSLLDRGAGICIHSGQGPCSRCPAARSRSPPRAR